MKIEFFAHSARLLRTLDHLLLWILSNNTGLDTVQDFLIKLGIKPCLQILKISNCGRLGPSQNICTLNYYMLLWVVYIILSIFYLGGKEVFAKYVGAQWIALSTFSFPERVSLRPSKWLLKPLKNTVLTR